MSESALTDQQSHDVLNDGWGALFRRPHLPVVVVLASGIGLYAMNLYFTAALMPSVVTEIGGARYYAWASTAYLITAVVATMFVSRFLATQGAARSYVFAFLTFAAGTVVSAVSPTMELFIGGRAIQGFGAGLLTGLGYAVVRTVLPSRLWTRATGLVSAMFGVGTLLGPSLGGLFAELGAWRTAFGVLAAIALVLVLVTVRSLPGKKSGTEPKTPVPVPSIVTLALTAAALSISSTLTGWLVPAALGGAAAMLVVFVSVDARNPDGVLPRLTYVRRGRLKWVYLTVAALCAGVMTENFIPLFAQELGGLSPLVAGLLGAVLSLGWVIAQLFSANASAAASSRYIRLAPWLLTVGLLGYGLLQFDAPGTGVPVLWASLLFVAGVGIGLAFPHLSVAAMSSTTDPVEGSKAAAAVSTTQLIAFTLASAIAGNLMALGGDTLLLSARWMIFGTAVLTFLGTLTSLAATKRAPGRQ
ncbi:MFS transporter [Rhodococcus sp. PSBB049]|uniref:MFS transporter n=1 Tax=Rhodococcus sp. PSBB049 TaxID=2812863 RepID=UPI00197EA36E|nr:MFS transporter [Rhodococcus sp. PSBB049]QSE72425.1 MFS transporter [Rhodococcus sp. PSBB049]